MGFLQPSSQVGKISSLLKRVWVEEINILKAWITLLPKQGNCQNVCWPPRPFLQQPGLIDSLSRSGTDQKDFSKLESRSEPQVNSANGETADVAKHGADDM